MALRDGKVLYMPSPRLRGPFVRIRPEEVPPSEVPKAVTIRYCRRWSSTTFPSNPTTCPSTSW